MGTTRMRNAMLALAIAVVGSLVWSGCGPDRQAEEAKREARKEAPPMAAPAPDEAKPPPELTRGARFEAAPAAKAIPILTRAGARRIKAVADWRHYVDYTPQKGLKIAGLDEALRKRRLAFHVEPFEQTTAADVSGGFHVDQAGWIVAVGLARQFDRMGHDVALELSKKLEERLGEKFRINLDSFRLRVTVTGTTAFWVRHERSGGQVTTTGHLDILMRITGRTAAGDRPVYSRRLAGAESAQGAGLAGAAARAKSVAQKLVDRQIAALLADPKLAQALVAYVKGQTTTGRE